METLVQTNQVVKDTKTILKDHLQPEAINNVVKSIEAMNFDMNSMANSIHADGSLASLLFYIKAQCNLDTGHGIKSFNGNAFGASFPGAGALIGDVYLAGGHSWEELFSNTTNFAFVATPVYTTFIFMSDDKTVLATYQAGSISIVTGGGHGAGTWS